MTIRKIPALGQAWSVDWRARLFERLRSRGFSTVTAFAESRPTTSTIELADELSTDIAGQVNHSDVAADQVIRIWREEARRDGEEATERFARRFLVGELCRDLSDGWRADWKGAEAQSAMSRMTALTARWASYMGDEYDLASERVLDAMLAAGREGSIPERWCPTSADDPLLVEIFRRHWR
jgi:hypothetical protein